MMVVYPELRRRLEDAVAAIIDEELHTRLWVRGERGAPSEFDFVDALLVVNDEMESFSESDLVGEVLVDHVELGAFLELKSAIDALVDSIGVMGSYEDALSSGGEWQTCLVKADVLRRRMLEADNR